MSIIRKAGKAADRKLTDLSTCPGCRHSSAAAGCRCGRGDCACGTNHNR